MCRGAIGDVLAESWPATEPRPLCRPARHRVHRKKIVAIDADARDAVPGAARGECPVLTAGEALEGRDGPLIIDHVQNDGRAIYGSKRQGMVEIRFSGGPLPDPAGRNAVLAPDGSRHGPANGLRKLSGEIPRDREDVAAGPVIHDRHLPALAHVMSVGEALA